MPTYFVDSSALVKRYVRETGTTWIRDLLARSAPRTIYVSEITGVEIVAAIARRGRPGDLLEADVASTISGVRRHLRGEYAVVALTSSILERGLDVAVAHALRGYDSVQLSSILSLRALRRASGLSDPVLVSSDRELNDAARIEGLMAVDPNDHP